MAKIVPITYQGYDIGWAEVYKDEVVEAHITNVEHISWLQELDYLYIDKGENE